MACRSSRRDLTHSLARHPRRGRGKRVVAVPELITPLPDNGPPQLARWRLALEPAGTVRASSGDRASTEVLVSPRAVGAHDVKPYGMKGTGKPLK